MTDRLDVVLVDRGLARSRSAARALIKEGLVEIDGRIVTKPSASVAEGAAIEVGDHRDWVSRGARKLMAAIDRFGIEIAGKSAIDVGASTGGFTEVLLDQKVASVVALDVGHGQLAERIAKDARVRNVEKTNVRDVDVEDLGGCFALVVADLSFISITKVAGKLAELACDHADLVVLVKPQFELERSNLGKDGIVRSDAERRRAVMQVASSLIAAGIGLRGLITSPITGGDGNVEYLLWGRKSEESLDLEVPS